MKTSDNLSHLGAITLNRVFGSKPTIAHRIISEIGSIKGLFCLTESQRNEILGPFSKYKDALCDKALEESFKESEKLNSLGARFLSIEDEFYPILLKECADAPIGLYYISNSSPEEIFSNANISIVGTRDISLYGKHWCEQIVKTLALAPQKPCIVSGLALGVDITAHLAALENGLPSIAVLPTGIDDVSPKSHYAIAKRLSQTKGCALISDFPVGYPVTAANFLRRNRIIAGLSSASILIESKKHGGGLITAGTAFDYGRDVFVLPGRIDDIRSQGCNLLVQEGKAEVIASLETLSVRMGLGHTTFNPEGSLAQRAERFYRELPPDMFEDVLKILNVVKENRGIDIESLANSAALKYPRTIQLSTMLQRDGFMEIDLFQRCSISGRRAGNGM